MGEDKSWREEIIMASSSTGGLCGYSSMNQIQGLMSDEASDQMFNLTTGGTGLDMIGFSTSNNKHTSFFPKEAEDDCWAHNTRLVVDDSSSLRSTTTTHALSLSLNSSIHPSPSTVAALFHHSFHQEFVCSTSRSSDQALFGEPHNNNNNNFQLNNSKYLVPAQELLMELCSLENNNEIVVKKQKREEDKGMGASGKKQGGVGSVELVELEKRKRRLVWMAEEVERRYRHYCNQMKGVVWSLEGVAGKGSARVYSALALKAMSRHFKCLKEGIMGEVEATRRCLGEKDGVGSGATKGETPRLKVIDQALRQQRAFQQMGLIDSHPWRPQRGLPERSVSILRAWLFDHFLNPYPTDADKHILARQTGLSRSQVSNWFINARVRLWKPMVEEMYMEEIKEQEKTSEGEAHIMSGNEINSIIGDEKKLEKAAPTISQGDEKPTVDESETCLIINNPNTTNNNNNYKTHHNMNPPHEHQSLGTSSFGSVELDFSGGMVSFGGSGNVSLTLGLQRDGGIPKGVSLAFPPAAPSYPHTHTSLLMYQNQKDQIHDSPYSLLDNQPQNLPYTHLVGSHSHLLHHMQG